MIFPKHEMNNQQPTSDPIKKQALDLIIDLYLNRKRDEDIEFLSANFASTHQIISSIGSSQLSGLTSLDVKNSKLIYGENEKKAPSQCLTLKECLANSMARPNFIISLVLLLSTLIFGAAKNIEQLFGSALTVMLFSMGIAFLRALTLFVCSQQLWKSSLAKTKNSIYQVVRNGNYVEVPQSEIVVGDIVELGFKEKVPATAILISNTQIFVKEGKKEPSQVKLNLERCLTRISGMSILDLKLSFEQSTLPSPIILRGSELIKGTTFSILVISVTEEPLLKKFEIATEEKFQNKAYEFWVSRLQLGWKNWSLFWGVVTVIFLGLGSLTDSKLFANNSLVQVETLFKLKLKISVIILILQVNSLHFFLNISFINLMNELKITESLDKLFMVKKIICNEKKIVEWDQINVGQLAVCDKTDLIGLQQALGLNPFVANIVEEARQLFNINHSSSSPTQGRKNKCRRIVHINKKDLKVISSVSALDDSSSKKAEQQARTPMPKLNLSFNFQKVSQHRGTFVDKREQDKKQKRTSEKAKTPQLEIGLKEIGNLKQIIHSRCRVKSKLVLDGLAGLAENGLKTYYYQTFDLKNLEQMTHILAEGKIRAIETQVKQRMVILSRKMNLVYGLTPIIISFHEGSYKSTSSRTLICLMGVTVAENNEIICNFRELESMGIKTTILINEYENEENIEERILKEYAHRRWIDPFQRHKILDVWQIKQILKRFVCKQCLIANCGCKDKIEVVANIQPFIQVSEKAKIIYNVEDNDFRPLQSVYSQVESHLISINSLHSSASDYLCSISACQGFVAKLRRTLIFFYATSIVYFLVSVLFWLRNLEIVSSLQIGFSFLLISGLFFHTYLLQIRAGKQRAAENDGRIKIITKQWAIIVYVTCLMVVLGTQLIYLFHYKIPEYKDNYDALIHKHNLDLSICKYGPNASLTKSFEVSECETPEIGLQFSRLSTFITAYVYFCLWSLAVVINRNFKSVWALILYLSNLSIFILVLEKMAWIIHGYSEGLNLLHYLILCGATFATLGTGTIFGYLTCKIPIIEYFSGEMQSCLNFQVPYQNDYISKLKLYNETRKKETEQSKNY